MSTGLMNKLKWGDAIRVNGIPQRTNYPVKPGDLITVRLDAEAAEYPAEDGPLDILYEDDFLLAQAPRPIAVRAVRQLLSRLRAGDDTCAAPHLRAVLELCRSDAPSGEVHLPSGMTAWREYDKLCLGHPGQEIALEPTLVSLNGTTRAGEWTILCEECTYEGQGRSGLEFWLRAEDTQTLQIRPRQTGDELKLPNRPGKSVKKWLVEEKIPRRYRENLPVFTDGGRLCAVAGLGVDERFLPALGEKARHLKLIPPGEKRDEKGMQLHADK